MIPPSSLTAADVLREVATALLVDSDREVQAGYLINLADRLEAAAPLPTAPKSSNWPEAGDLMRYLGKNGHDFERKDADKVFTVGATYEVKNIDIQSWSHSIAFVGFKGRWNGVMFELVRDNPPHGVSEPGVGRAGDERAGPGALVDAKSAALSSPVPTPASPPQSAPHDDCPHVYHKGDQRFVNDPRGCPLCGFKPPPPASQGKGEILPCHDEAEAFEQWAIGEGMDMTTHPLHWLFLNHKTYAARQGWKAALAYIGGKRVEGEAAPGQMIVEPITLHPTSDGRFDELLAKGVAYIHFEMMSDNCLWMSLDDGVADHRFFVSAKGRLTITHDTDETSFAATPTPAAQAGPMCTFPECDCPRDPRQSTCKVLISTPPPPVEDDEIETARILGLLRERDLDYAADHMERMAGRIREQAGEIETMREVYNAAMAWGAAEQWHEEEATSMALANATRKARALSAARTPAEKEGE